ncbi:MAG: glycosyltransferase family 4 protein [Acidimicrobiales bacterium]
MTGDPSSDRWDDVGEPLILHVIPTPLARGAQREARALADELDRPGVRAHRVLSLFDGPAEVECDLALAIPDGARPGEGFNWRALPRIRTALARLDPVCVVAHGGEPLKYLVPAMVGRRRPLVYYAIGTYGSSAGHSPQVALWRRMLTRVDVVAVGSDDVADECIRLLKVRPDRVALIRNGRDPDLFHPRSGGRTDDRPVIAFVGALTSGKRPDRFVEAVAALRARGLEFRAILIGDGALRPMVETSAREADVEMLGSRSDVADLLGRADIMVFPSRPQGEGMPGVLIEAGLSALPVVATDVPGVRSVVDDGTTGFIVDVDDLDGMVDALARLVEQPSLRSAMGEAARKRCVEQFSIEVVAKVWLQLLATLLPPGVDATA